MFNRSGWMTLVAVLAVGAPLTAAADTKQIPMVVIHSETQIAAKPAAVWTYITTGKNFATWCPEWKSPKNAKIVLSRVGESVDFQDQWGNGGRSVVTYAVGSRELRVAHEPMKGDYVCQAKFVLTASGNGTHLDFWDQYSDASSPADLEATMQKMQTQSDQSLAAIKSGVENPPPATAEKK